MTLVIVLVVFFCFYSVKTFTVYLEGIQPDGSSLSFTWKSEMFTGGVPNYRGTKLYGLNSRSDGTYLVMIDIEDFANITSYITKINSSITTLSGVLNNGIGFTSKLALFSLKGDVALISDSLINDAAILLYGPLENSIIAINITTLAYYTYTNNNKLTPIFLLKTDIYSKILSDSLIICAHKSLMLYMIIVEDRSHYLISFDYSEGEIKKRIHLQNFVNSKMNLFLLSNTEEHIMMYYNYKAYFYKIVENGFVLVNQNNIQLSAVTNLPLGNIIIAKAELSPTVYIISMSNGSILQELSIKESEYLMNVYAKFYEEEVTVLFTDFSNWRAYRVIFEGGTNSKSLVNVYVILMSAFLILILIISVIYVFQSGKVTAENPPSNEPQNESQVHILNSRNLSSIPRILDTNLHTDLNETRVNFLNTEMFRRRFLVCPLTGMVLKDPVVAADGYTYERKAIEQWLEQNSISPTTQEPIPNKYLIPNTVIAGFLPKPNNSRNQS